MELVMAPNHQHETKERAAALRRRAARDAAASAAEATPAHPLLTLQRQVGNAQVSRMLAQREEMPEEEEVQARRDPALQREEMPEEEEVQARRDPALQREEAPEEEEVQAKRDPALQREAAEEEEVQAKRDLALQREEAAEEEEVQAKRDLALQREEAPEEEEVQAQRDPALQREAAEEEEEVQAQRDPALQREAAEEEEEVQAQRDPALQREAAEEEEIQAKPEVGMAGGPISEGLASRINAQRGGGSSLDENTRTQMENNFGTSFADVRVHTGSEAQQLNRSVGAKAFTTGNDIFFGPNGNPTDQGLLAHELTHVVQQRSMNHSGPMTVGPAGDQYEQEADGVSSAITTGAAPATPQRKTDE
jgi:hypothetical protein